MQSETEIKPPERDLSGVLMKKLLKVEILVWIFLPDTVHLGRNPRILRP